MTVPLAWPAPTRTSGTLIAFALHMTALNMTHRPINTSVLCALSAAVCIAGCAACQSTPSRAASAPQRTSAPAHAPVESRDLEPYAASSCPMGIPATDLASIPMEHGLRLVFTTDSAYDGQLLRRVQLLASRYNELYDDDFGSDLPGTWRFATVAQRTDGAALELRGREGSLGPDYERALATIRADVAVMQEHGVCPVFYEEPVAGR